MKANEFKLYQSSGSPNSRRVRIFLAEKGICMPMALVERGRLRVGNFYRDLDARLASSPFVAGNRFSAADITAVVTIDFATKALNLPIPTEGGALRRWYELVFVRASMSA